MKSNYFVMFFLIIALLGCSKEYLSELSDGSLTNFNYTDEHNVFALNSSSSESDYFDGETFYKYSIGFVECGDTSVYQERHYLIRYDSSRLDTTTLYSYGKCPQAVPPIQDDDPIVNIDSSRNIPPVQNVIPEYWNLESIEFYNRYYLNANPRVLTILRCLWEQTSNAAGQVDFTVVPGAAEYQEQKVQAAMFKYLANYYLGDTIDDLLLNLPASHPNSKTRKIRAFGYGYKFEPYNYETYESAGLIDFRRVANYYIQRAYSLDYES